MDFAEWSALSEEEQGEKCQFLDPYDDRDLFRAVESAFWDAYGKEGLNRVRCDLGPFIGPYNCIVVEMSTGKGVSKPNLPKTFMGFPVIPEAAAGGKETESCSF